MRHSGSRKRQGSHAVDVPGPGSSTPRQVDASKRVRCDATETRTLWQVIVYNLLKKYLGPAPVYATVGNHDTYVGHAATPFLSAASFVLTIVSIDPVPDDTLRDGRVSRTAIQLVRTHRPLVSPSSSPDAVFDYTGCTNTYRPCGTTKAGSPKNPSSLHAQTMRRIRSSGPTVSVSSQSIRTIVS